MNQSATCKLIWMRPLHNRMRKRSMILWLWRPKTKSTKGTLKFSKLKMRTMKLIILWKQKTSYHFEIRCLNKTRKNWLWLPQRRCTLISLLGLTTAWLPNIEINITCLKRIKLITFSKRCLWWQFRQLYAYAFGWYLMIFMIIQLHIQMNSN